MGNLNKMGNLVRVFGLVLGDLQAEEKKCESVLSWNQNAGAV